MCSNTAFCSASHFLPSMHPVKESRKIQLMQWATISNYGTQSTTKQNPVKLCITAILVNAWTLEFWAQQSVLQANSWMQMPKSFNFQCFLIVFRPVSTDFSDTQREQSRVCCFTVNIPLGWVICLVLLTWFNKATSLALLLLLLITMQVIFTTSNTDLCNKSMRVAQIFCWLKRKQEVVPKGSRERLLILVTCILL